MGAAYDMQDDALLQAEAQVQQMIAAGADLEQELARLESERKPISKARPYKRSWHGHDQSDGSGYYHGSRNEE